MVSESMNVVFVASLACGLKTGLGMAAMKQEPERTVVTQAKCVRINAKKNIAE